MSVGPEVEPVSNRLDDELVDSLVDSFRLSQQQVALIREVMSERAMGFVSAALYLNLVTAKQATEILERTQDNDANVGVVETALQRLSGGRVATVPPSIFVKPSKELLLAHDPDHPHCERVRALRTGISLLLSSGTRDASVVAVLSPGPKEGRSQLAAELAIGFAQLGRRTLLVEADMRRPRQHVLFGAGDASGMAQYLASNRDPQLLRVEGLPQLSLVISGPVPPNPLELLSDGRFERLLSDWRRAFDVLIIDTPAVTQFSDGLAIAALAEQVLMVSRANITSLKDMKETMRRLASTNARVLGGVINNF